jgi:flavin-dependent dehydrogenase
LNTHTKEYDVAITGGGLAGLALSIQLARKGYAVIVIEKEQYPFHRVCGEYISLESWDFLNELGVGLVAMNVSSITHLQVSSVNGKLLEQRLPLGGFGISRYELDHTLVKIARQAGVIVQENTKVNDIVFTEAGFVLDASGAYFHAKVACGSYGKRSNIDIKWNRPFITSARNGLNNYIGIKYHIHTDFPANTIALHNFRNGYCGIVKIENDKYNLCYLTTAANLRECKGSIQEMENSILGENPHLRLIFSQSEVLFDAPVTISQISFDKKSQVEDHVLMIGDAAGMITPLCGNGMSMALHASKLAAEQVCLFLEKRITREVMEQEYVYHWQRRFARRLQMGRRIQALLGSRWLTNSLITLAKPFPRLVRSLVKQTHGEAF